MTRRNPVLVTALSVALALPAAALAQPTESPSAVKAAQLATQKAKHVTYQLMDRSSGVSLGTVTLQRIGGTRTRIRVDLVNPAVVEPRVTLRSGADCQHPVIANAPRSPVLLNPFTGRTSTTVVNLPMSNLTSGNYLVRVQTATQRAQAIDACSQLH